MDSEDPLGNLTSSPKYDVYGNVRSNGGTASTKHGFVGSLGHLSEAETGLIYMSARYMDPAVGRFVSQDPKCDGVNWFVYSDNNSVNKTDPSGKDSELLSIINHVFSDDEMGQGAFDAWNEGGASGLADFLEENYLLPMNFAEGEAPGIFGRFQMLLQIDEDVLGYLLDDEVGEAGMMTGNVVDAESIFTLVNGAVSVDMIDAEL